MRIEERTPERLVVVDRPFFMAGLCWLLGLILIFLGFFDAKIDSLGQQLLVLGIGAGLCGFTWWAFPFQRFVFDRPAGRLYRTRLRPFWRREDGMALGEIRRARQQAQWSDGARLTRLALELPDQVVAISLSFRSGNLDPVESEINRWLAGEDPA